MSSSLDGKTGTVVAKRRVVAKFLLFEVKTAPNVTRRIKHVYDDDAIDYSTVAKWFKRVNDG